MKMSYFSNNVTPTAAGVVVVLVVSLIIFWASNGAYICTLNGEESTSHNTTVGSASYQSVEGVNQWITNGVMPQSTSSAALFSDQYESNDSIPNEINDILFTNHDDKIEYVMPLKISENQDEDPPDEQSVTKRHHSGNFRLATASVWDPHPQYEFTAFGRKFRLRLAHNANFLSPDVKVTHIKRNDTVLENPQHHKGCFYKGDIEGDGTSDVSVSLCGGMTGHVRTSSYSYTIKPVQSERGDGDETFKHVFYRESKPRSNGSRLDGAHIQPGDNNCGVIDNDLPNTAPTSQIGDSSSRNLHVMERDRKRRSSAVKLIWNHQMKSELLKNLLEELTTRDERSRFTYDSPTTSYNRSRNSEYENTDRLSNKLDPSPGWRNRRSASKKYFVEIMVVADQKMMEYHGTELVHYILVLMSTVHRIYKDPSIGNPINIAVTKVVQMDYPFGSPVGTTDGISAAKMLKTFCKWQKSNNPHEPSPEHHDAALLLTRENLCQDPDKKRCETLGLAELGGMCSFGSSCAIVQDNGLPTAFTIAHEIGHVLNMPHDDDSKCRKFQVRPDVHNFMTRRLDSNRFRWEWSTCSRHHITEFLESEGTLMTPDNKNTGSTVYFFVFGKTKRDWHSATLTTDFFRQSRFLVMPDRFRNAFCLLDEPSSVISRPEAMRLPGEDYSGNDQCELVFGRGSKICTSYVEDVCKRLWCTGADDPECRTQNMPWADGTPCSGDDESTTKWCHKGECVSAGNLEPISGQWGEWGPYGTCSRTCGGGIQTRYRECNGPSPQNGGDYCIGERAEDRSCATNNCPRNSLDFREEQCSAFNYNNFGIRGLDINTEWHAKYTRFIPEDRCKLFCQVDSKQYYMLRDKVIDGTPCGPDTFDICVHGRCKPAGCDHILNSTAELDTCGVCTGDNSTCQKITGSHNSSQYGYTRITKIPAGSSNINVKQHGWKDCNNDSNYLALRLGEFGKYILNGNFTIMHRKLIIHPGITVEYSGSETLDERLNSSWPISDDIILEILSVGKVDPPQITYEYTVPKSILKNYNWTLGDWSNCDHECQGTEYRRSRCENTVSGEVVSDDYCRRKSRPQERSRMCNDYCTLEWHIAEVSECSNHCGPGNRTISTECIQTLTKNHAVPPEPVAIHICSHLERPPSHQACIGPCDESHWYYGQWGSCSVTCGDGTQSRTASCVDKFDRVVSDSNCANSVKAITRICTREACPQWRFGDWSTCPVTCGIGVRERPVWCHVENRVVDPELCANVVPEVQERCDAGPCLDRNTDNFQDCATECGEEEREYRRVRCRDDTGRIMSDESCHFVQRRKLSKKCRRKACATSESDGAAGPPVRDSDKLRWRVSSWTRCSKDCGDGIQDRTVSCHRINAFGWVSPISSDGCPPEKRPRSNRICKLRDCDDEFYWSTGKWRKCSHSCGRNGRQTRRLFCRDSSGRRHPRFNCPREFKPKRERRCNQRRCGPRTCLEAKKRVKMLNDGEYTLLIGGKYMKVYCLNVTSNTPREYLTLPAGERHNYAEVYDKRLLNPNQCPFRGRRNNSCECAKEADGISGLTYYKRVRINPTTLIIVADDFTFSRTKGHGRIEYGTAGDCYSNANCPQGRFSINLIGTMLRISSDVSWSATKSRASFIINTINEQRITGKCGGYCGFCTPKSGLKLEIFVP